jgi:GNAT superfamily N-acetyltransferase
MLMFVELEAVCPGAGVLIGQVKIKRLISEAFVNTDFNAYQISDEIKRVDFKKVTEWLSGSYWSSGIGREEVERGAKNSSLVIGVYAADGSQVGYARLASDKTRFGYFMDVFVEPAHRKKGIAQAMVRFAMEHPDHRPVYTWLLSTRDAHKVYEKEGFKPFSEPGKWMGIFKGRPKSQEG